ncbi:MAG: hypothetical protein ACOC7S_00510 [Planctomycetota bacterium]
MRLSEKTIELNFCSQFSRYAKTPVIWFGLTQLQEARAGFDACTKLRGRLLLLQFKASNHILKRSGARRFKLPHGQLQSLQARVNGYRRSVFYVFPDLGNTHEFAHNSDIVRQSWLLDVSGLPSLPLPTKQNGNPRKNRIHYADLRAPIMHIHSELVEAKLTRASEVIDGLQGADGVQGAFEDFDAFWQFCGLFRRNAIGAVIPQAAPS